MGKAARIKRQQHAPPPVGTPNAVNRKLVWVATGGVVAVAVVVVAVLLATRSSPSTPSAAAVPTSDKNASASLVRAAAAIGFHPTTEPGVGEIEGKPADEAQPASNPNLLKVGSFAPGFTLNTPEGQSVSLASYHGKAVLLEFFASWCPHCNAEAPHLSNLAKSLDSRDIRFLSVNADGETAPSIYAFHRYYGLPYPALVDPSSKPGSFNSSGNPGRVTTKYRVEAFPTFYVINPNGKIVWRSDGEQPDALLRAWMLEAADE